MRKEEETMETYEPVTIKVIRFETEDILTTSNFLDGDPIWQNP